MSTIPAILAIGDYPLGISNLTDMLWLCPPEEIIRNLNILCMGFT
jgi:hypothetical protein